MLTPGHVIITEGDRKSLVSRLIACISENWATHVFLVTAPDEAVEAVFPRVKALALSDRLAILQATDRAYVVMESLGASEAQRTATAYSALTFVGRFYDIWQIFLYALFKRFWKDGKGTLICSRLITLAYEEAGIILFPEMTIKQWFSQKNAHTENLRRGFATPGDLLRSNLVVVEFIPSSRVHSVQDFFPT